MPAPEMSLRPSSRPIFAPSFAPTHSRNDSTTSDSSEEADKGTPAADARRPSESWVDSVSQRPTLAYHHTPSASTLSSNATEVSALYAGEPLRKRHKAPKKSHLLDREAGNPKPWMKGRKNITRDKKSYFTTLGGILLGVGGGLALILHSCLSVDHDKYDLLFEDDFAGISLNKSHWKVEERVGGGESNDFTWFTGHNHYVEDGALWMVPTLTSETMLPADYALLNSTVLQLGSGCDSIHQSDCQIVADTENNQTLTIPPVQSAMISTRGKVNMKFGRIVMRARMPTGDWLWPQVSLVPLDEVYGPYPASGLITVFESRGNQATKRPQQLNNEAVSGLHWGTTPSYDRFYLTQGLYKVYRNFFNQRYYDFGVDWTPHSVTMWVNSRTRITFRYGFGKEKTFWELGSFGYSYGNGTIIQNPWASADDQHIAPFDQEFYLRIALLAGGTDGYWMDDLPNKPWRNSDDRSQAMQRFLNYINVWSPSWPSGDKIRDRGMAIDKISVYQRRN